MQLIVGKCESTSLILLLAKTYQMPSYASYEYITTVNYTTTDRHYNLLWRISFLFSRLSRILLWGWRNSALLTLHCLANYFSFHLFLPGVKATGSQNCPCLQKEKSKSKQNQPNKKAPYLLSFILKYLSLIIMQIKGGTTLLLIIYLFFSLQIFRVVAGFIKLHFARVNG